MNHVTIAGNLEWDGENAYVKLHQLTYDITAALLSILPRPIQHLKIVFQPSAEKLHVEGIMIYFLRDALLGTTLKHLIIESTTELRYGVSSLAVLMLLDSCVVLQEFVFLVSDRNERWDLEQLIQRCLQRSNTITSIHTKLGTEVFMVNRTTKEVARSAKTLQHITQLMKDCDEFESFAYESEHPEPLSITLAAHTKSKSARTDLRGILCEQRTHHALNNKKYGC